MQRIKIGICFFALLGLFSQSVFTNNVSCLAMSMPSANKHASMVLPCYEKLFQGAGPATNDNQDNVDAKTKNKDASSDLSPLTLSDTSDQNNTNNTTPENDANDAVLKSTVSTTDYVPHNNPAVLETRSIKGKSIDKGSLSEQAAAVKVGPLPLLETDDEAQKKVDAVLDAEKIQLADLWEATLTRSPDIQFIIQKLQPTSNQAHLTNVLAKMLSTAAFGGLGAMSMMSPNLGTYAAASMGGSMIQSVLGTTQSKADKKAKLTQEEELMMFNMVRATCDKLVACYRDYKKYSNSLSRAANDLQDLQSMAADARTGQDSAKQLEMDYTLRKQQRDLDSIADDLRHYRQNLIDLAGGEAVTKLDQQLADERTKLEQVAAGNVPNEQIQANDDISKKNNSIGEISSDKNKTKTASTLCPQS